MRSGPQILLALLRPIPAVRVRYSRKLSLNWSITYQNLVILCWHMLGDQLVKNSDHMCDRMDSILALDGQTDGKKCHRRVIKMTLNLNVIL